MTRRPTEDLGLLSGTQLMDFSDRAWLPCDNADVLSPIVPSVTHPELFVLT